MSGLGETASEWWIRVKKENEDQVEEEEEEGNRSGDSENPSRVWEAEKQICPIFCKAGICKKTTISDFYSSSGFPRAVLGGLQRQLSGSGWLGGFSEPRCSSELTFARTMIWLVVFGTRFKDVWDWASVYYLAPLLLQLFIHFVWALIRWKALISVPFFFFFSL